METPSPAEGIVEAIRAIARGQVAGYGEVARRAGLPGRARMVARLLSHNDDPRLPWHRVLRSDGRIAFPPDAPQFAEQVARLRAEGVVVDRGRVTGLRAAATLDEQLWRSPDGHEPATAATTRPVRRSGQGRASPTIPLGTRRGR